MPGKVNSKEPVGNSFEASAEGKLKKETEKRGKKGPINIWWSVSLLPILFYFAEEKEEYFALYMLACFAKKRSLNVWPLFLTRYVYSSVGDLFKQSTHAYGLYH